MESIINEIEKQIDRISQSISEDKNLKFEEIIKNFENEMDLNNEKIKIRWISSFTNLIKSNTDEYNKQHLDFIINFYLSKIHDYSVLSALVEGFLYLINDSSLPNQYTEMILKNILKHVHVQSLWQPARNKFFQLVLTSLKIHLECITQFSKPFLEGVIDFIDGERDPRNLFLTFQIFLKLCNEFPDLIPNQAREMISIISKYYPINFKMPKTLKLNFTLNELNGLIDGCFCAHDSFLNYSLPFLLKKSASHSRETKLKSLNTIKYCLTKFDSESVSNVSTKIFNSLYYELENNATDNEMIKSGVQIISSLINKFTNNDQLKNFFKQNILPKVTKSIFFAKNVQVANVPLKILIKICNHGIIREIVRNFIFPSLILKLEELEKLPAHLAILILKLGKSMLKIHQNVEISELSQQKDQIYQMFKIYSLLPYQTSIFKKEGGGENTNENEKEKEKEKENENENENEKEKENENENNMKDGKQQETEKEKEREMEIEIKPEMIKLTKIALRFCTYTATFKNLFEEKIENEIFQQTIDLLDQGLNLKGKLFFLIHNSCIKLLILLGGNKQNIPILKKKIISPLIKKYINFYLNNGEKIKPNIDNKMILENEKEKGTGKIKETKDEIYNQNENENENDINLKIISLSSSPLYMEIILNKLIKLIKLENNSILKIIKTFTRIINKGNSIDCQNIINNFFQKKYSNLFLMFLKQPKLFCNFDLDFTNNLLNVLNSQIKIQLFEKIKKILFNPILISNDFKPLNLSTNYFEHFSLFLLSLDQSYLSTVESFEIIFNSLIKFVQINNNPKLYSFFCLTKIFSIYWQNNFKNNKEIISNFLDNTLLKLLKGNDNDNKNNSNNEIKIEMINNYQNYYLFSWIIKSALITNKLDMAKRYWETLLKTISNLQSNTLLLKCSNIIFEKNMEISILQADWEKKIDLFFNIIFPDLQLRYKKSVENDSKNVTNLYLLTISIAINNISTDSFIDKINNIFPIISNLFLILENLPFKSSDNEIQIQIIISFLEILKKLLKDPNSKIEKIISDLIPFILQNTSFSNSMKVRIHSIQLLNLILFSFPKENILKFKKLIIEELKNPINDKKRKVRREARKCRNCWIMMND
ncbi:DNA repair/transcription protein met18/mms19 [Anaeramoeba flamelloides]|uniref:MMS19 nucleotide excision repair protein n=1 Tax=Anaeramoeba flamelloides TaxID=1746091 RepID=A0AAV7ZH55_9EUKA|nr:DNA repair/transcription protein met18/mms19 [Anaeramoeba flamelloides]